MRLTALTSDRVESGLEHIAAGLVDDNGKRSRPLARSTVVRVRAVLVDILRYAVRKKWTPYDYRSANIRAGYVYVISNAGSFGKHMVKIGMTRRLEPMDRVKELGDASVPFPFEIHALFFADDAVSAEPDMPVDHRRQVDSLHPENTSQLLQRLQLDNEIPRVCRPV